MSIHERIANRTPSLSARLACAVAIVLLLACARQPETGTAEPGGANGKGAKTASARMVAAEPAVVRPLTDEITVSAEFRPYQEIDVMAKVAGYVKEIHFDVGTRVAEGQLLAVLEIPEMLDEIAKLRAAVERGRSEVERARDGLKTSETAHEISHLNFNRLQSVMTARPGLVAQHEIDAAHNRDLVSESQIASARTALVSAEQAVKIQEAEVAKSQTLYNYARVTAPFSGVISRRYVDTGSMVQAGTASQAKPVARLSQTSTLRLILPIPESVIPRLKIGAPVEVRVGTLNRTFRGRLARETGRIVSATRTMETEVDVPNPNGSLVPGMFADARLKLEERNVLSIPVAAVDQDADSTTVMVVTKMGTVERRRIVPGLETADRVEVQSGLDPGDHVVISGRGQLEQGTKVVVSQTGARL